MVRHAAALFLVAAVRSPATCVPMMHVLSSLAVLSQHGGHERVLSVRICMGKACLCSPFQQLHMHVAGDISLPLQVAKGQSGSETVAHNAVVKHSTCHGVLQQHMMVGIVEAIKVCS